MTAFSMGKVHADQPMSDLDALVWNVDQHAHRTTIGALIRFAEPIDADLLRARVDRAVRAVPRLRQRVVDGASPLAPPRWSADPDFCVGAHMRTATLDPSSDDALRGAVRDALAQPLDRSRPQWELTHFTGLAGAADAILLRAHHAIADGIAGVELMLELFDLDPTMGPLSRPARPSARTDEVAEAANTTGSEAPAPRRGSSADCAAAGHRAGEAVGSALRMLRPRMATPAISSRRSDALDVGFFSVPIEGLRRAGRSHGGTINDAFLAAVSLGLGDHVGVDHESPLRISVPVNTRPLVGNAAAAGPHAGNNRWAPSRIDIDLRDTADVSTLMDSIRREMQRVRRDPAHRLLPSLAAGLRRLPASASATLFTQFGAGLDVAASNVPGSPARFHLGPQPVVALIPFGPLSGCAINITLLTHADTAHVGVCSDSAAIDDPDELQRNLEAGFATITAMPAADPEPTR